MLLRTPSRGVGEEHVAHDERLRLGGLLARSTALPHRFPRFVASVDARVLSVDPRVVSVERRGSWG